MKLFTRQFWIQAAERAAVAFGGTLAVAPVFTGHAAPGLHAFVAAAINAGLAAGYSIVKSVSGVQTVNFLTAVSKSKGS